MSSQPRPAGAPASVPSLPDAGSGGDVDERADLGALDDELAARYAWPEPVLRPTVRANMIGSLDGGSTLDGRSGGLGNEADRRLFAVLRDLADVVLVGAGTVRTEGYRGIRLDDARRARRVRWGRPAQPPPIAVVTRRGLPADLGFFTDVDTPPIVITTESGAAAAPAGTRVIAAPGPDVDLAAALRTLGAWGLPRVHCEGGPAILGALLAGGLVDDLCLTLAPRLLGPDATPLIDGPAPDPRPWALADAWSAGDHLFTRYRRRG